MSEKEKITTSSGEDFDHDAKFQGYSIVKGKKTDKCGKLKENDHNNAASGASSNADNEVTALKPAIGLATDAGHFAQLKRLKEARPSGIKRRNAPPMLQMPPKLQVPPKTLFGPATPLPDHSVTSSQDVKPSYSIEAGSTKSSSSTSSSYPELSGTVDTGLPNEPEGGHLPVIDINSTAENIMDFMMIITAAPAAWYVLPTLPFVGESDSGDESETEYKPTGPSSKLLQASRHVKAVFEAQEMIRLAEEAIASIPKLMVSTDQEEDESNENKRKPRDEEANEYRRSTVSLWVKDHGITEEEFIAYEKFVAYEKEKKRRTEEAVTDSPAVTPTTSPVSKWSQVVMPSTPPNQVTKTPTTPPTGKTKRMGTPNTPPTGKTKRLVMPTTPPTGKKNLLMPGQHWIPSPVGSPKLPTRHRTVYGESEDNPGKLAGGHAWRKEMKEESVKGQMKKKAKEGDGEEKVGEVKGKGKGKSELKQGANEPLAAATGKRCADKPLCWDSGDEWE